ncbi:MAG: PQQ-binding-like beta-propeller repeat protein, partial [Planctomyces sp.]
MVVSDAHKKKHPVRPLARLTDVNDGVDQTGLILWQVNIAKEFHARPLTWGHSGSPILSGNRLIVQPGGSEGSLVALDSETGDVIWKTPGTAAGYSSLLLKAVKQTEQVIGYDADSLGGWDAKTGKRLWRLSPAV